MVYTRTVRVVQISEHKRVYRALRYYVYYGITVAASTTYIYIYIYINITYSTRYTRYSIICIYSIIVY